MLKQKESSCSHNADLVGNFESVAFFSKHNEGLLFTTGGDRGVDLADLGGESFLASSLDLGLVGLLINDEHKGIVVFSDLDSGFRTAGVLDDGILVIVGLFLLVGVVLSQGLGAKLLNLGATESGRGPAVGLLGVVSTLLNLFASVLSLFNLFSH